MKIEKMNYKNKRINITNISLDFSNKGLYFLVGENGAGKTSIIEKIIFKKNLLKFENSDYKKLYKKNPGSVVSYVQQDFYEENISVLNFIKKGNNDIDNEELNKYMNMFALDKIDMNENYNNLSGGEKKKISIISSLLKDTPFIIFDEPTNHLDDTSVIMFKNIINELRENKSIVIVTHDSRLDSLCPDGIYSIKNNKVTCEKDNNNYKVEKIADKSIFLSLRPLLSLVYNRLALIMFVFIGVIASLIVALNNIEIRNNYATQSLPEKNIICIYSVEKRYSNLNRDYVKEKGLTVSDEFKRINYADIINLSEMKEVEKMYLIDYEYLFNNYEMITDGEILNAKISFPKELFFNCFNQTDYPFSIDFHGDYPNDGLNEICISINELVNTYGYEYGEADNSIGDMIEVDGRMYKIVGIMDIPNISLISYEHGENYGIYEYDSTTYEDFVLRQVEYFKEKAMTNIGYANSFMIVCKDNSETSMLNYLVSNYPSNNYSSHNYISTLLKRDNRQLFFKMLVINLAVSLFSSFVIFVLSKDIFKSNVGIIIDYKNYYIKNKGLMIKYMLYLLAPIVIIMALASIIELLLDDFICFGIILFGLDIFLFVLVILASYLVVWRNDINK